ncbi:transcriptional regulator, GntR family [Plantibacter sp. VKM Ac-1784]|uniref:Transcriptional regulator, GntR family n=2 Tax=Plantibacter elymi (nom. nud.) TaxID=199708 RepID=A0ABY1RGZ7_9MICO|nr:transcriptional regulator, GntR family [Plantibacter sp. VKM Ac-1784]
MGVAMSMSAIRPAEERLSLRAQVERAVSAAIISGELAPGTMISVPTLAVQFNVSATPVREAMLDLEKRDFVEAVRNKGFRVTVVSEASLRNTAQIRQLLEPPAMADLAEVFDHESLPALRQQADDIVAGARDGDLTRYLEADQAFHLALTAKLGNPLLVELVADLRGRTRLVGLAAMLDSQQLDRSAVEHHELLDALERGDGVAARELMHRHIGHTTGWWAGKPESDAE